MRLHDLRHTATSILAKRVPIKQVQAMLGHEDVQTTLSIYTHIVSEGQACHRFRKWYATEIYNANGYDIALVQRLLQLSSAAVKQRYIGIELEHIETAIQNHAQLI